MGKSYKRILLLGIGFILCGTLAAQEQKKELKEKAEKTKEKNETEDTETEESGLNEEKTIKQ